MGIRTAQFSGNRTLVLGSLGEPVVHQSLRSPFATLLPAYDEAERRKAELIVGSLVDLGCVEFCCVGPEAEQLHDSIDWIIEDRGALGVVTTAHTDYTEACEYFVFAAAGKPPVLLGLVSSHPEVVTSLEQAACTE